MPHPPLQDGAWKGRRCFILGGGPSLARFNVGALRDELTIGVNVAALNFNPTVAFVSDLRTMNLLSADQRWQTYEGRTVWLYKGERAYRNSFPGVQVIPEHAPAGMPSWSKSLLKGLYRGTNAGIGALNLAELLQADPIYLVGFDFAGKNGSTVNWHTEYPKEWTQTESVYRRYVVDFETIQKSGVLRARVVNVNPDSRLRCFEMVPCTEPP